MESAAPEERGHWWSVKRPQLALVLENKGSVARDHLALERTFLAWLRTSVSLVSAGIAITQLFKIPTLSSEPAVPDPDWEAVLASSIAHAAQSVDPLDQQHALQLILSTPSPVPAEAWSLERIGKPLGASFIALGIVVMLFGTARFFRVQAQLTGGKFSPSRVEVSISAVLAFTLLVSTFSVLLGMHLPL